MSDTLTAFFREACEHRKTSIRVKDLYQGYTAFCRARDRRPMTRANFGRRLADHSHTPQRDEQGFTWVTGVDVLPLPGVPKVGRRPLLVLPEGLAFEDISALALVAAELARQRTAERHSVARDDAYPAGVLETAGGEYLTHAGYHRRDDFPVGRPSDSWPWDAEHWMPKTAMRDATRGCALGVAGISLRLRRGERAEG